MEAKLKQPYHKPMIERIDLIGEQLAVAGCKRTNAGGKNMTGANACNKGNKCKTVNGS
jgi:hypothetical protein